MNRISFYFGVVLIIIGLFIWLFKQSSHSGRNSFKAFGMEFSFSTPAFVVMAFGILLMSISTNFDEAMSPPPPPPKGKNYITIKDAVYASKWHALVNGFRHAVRVCNNTEMCTFACNNETADDGDPDKGAPKRCIINYYCSETPNNPIHFDEAEGGVYKISCPN